MKDTQPNNALNKSNYLPGIDLLRAFAIILVFIRHSHYALPIFIKKYPIWLQGTWSGVDLFFVISGFVITQSLFKSLCQGGKSISIKKYLIAFYIKRFCRLFPMAIISLALFLTLASIFNKSGSFGQWHDIKHEIIPILFYYYNYYVFFGGSSNLSWFWSLSIEEQFYFIYPILLYKIANYKNLIILSTIVIIVVTFILRPFTTPIFPEEANSLWPKFTTPTHLRVDALFAGCLCASIQHFYSVKIKDWLLKYNKLSCLILMICLFGVATLGGILPHLEYLSYPSIIFCSFLLILIAASKVSIICIPNICYKTLLWIGKRSYTIYLLHLTMIYTVTEIDFRLWGKDKIDISWLQGISNIIIAITLTSILAAILYKNVEQPINNWGHYWARKFAK